MFFPEGQVRVFLYGEPLSAYFAESDRSFRVNVTDAGRLQG